MTSLSLYRQLDNGDVSTGLLIPTNDSNVMSVTPYSVANIHLARVNASASLKEFFHNYRLASKTLQKENITALGQHGQLW